MAAHGDRYLEKRTWGQTLFTSSGHVNVYVYVFACVCWVFGLEEKRLHVDYYFEPPPLRAFHVTSCLLWCSRGEGRQQWVGIVEKHMRTV